MSLRTLLSRARAPNLLFAKQLAALGHCRRRRRRSRLNRTCDAPLKQRASPKGFRSGRNHSIMRRAAGGRCRRPICIIGSAMQISRALAVAIGACNCMRARLRYLCTLCAFCALHRAHR